MLYPHNQGSLYISHPLSLLRAKAADSSSYKQRII
jgi:hypothetical protein